MTVKFAKYFLGAVLLMPLPFANAQVTGQAGGLPASVVSAFLANPGQALAQFPAGGPELTKQVRDLLSSDKSTLPSIMGLLKTASPDQQNAIASGLAQAAKIAAKNDPQFAGQIQSAVASSGLPEVLRQYASIAGDTGTASTGGGGGGGGGVGGGGPNTQGAPTGGQNNGSSPASTNASTNTTGNLFTGSSLGGSSDTTDSTTTFNITTNTTTTNNTSVSPQ